jgi:mannosyltransferase OCH1-like enzyme/glycosyltransferase involved in cell wall biosynthesis
MGVKFSVCLIARNEAANLWRLHKSLKEFLAREGEVVLVDTGSTDDTPGVARGLGFKVFEVGEKFIFEIPDTLAKAINERFVVPPDPLLVKAGDKLFDYSAARNYSARMASNDVVSMPDCDEQYTNLDIDAIERVIDQGFQQMEFHFIFAHYPNGQPAVQFRQCKMYDRRAMHWVGIVHEVLQGTAKRTYLPPSVLLLEHFQAPQAHRARYMPGLSLDCYLNQDNDRNSHYLGRELIWSGRLRSAIKELTRHVNMNRWQQERGQSMVLIGDAHRALGEEDKAVESWHRAIQIDDTRREPWLRLADYYWKKNNPQRTLCYALASLEIPPNDCYMNVGAHYTFEPHERLYWALWALGDRKRSAEHFWKAFNYDPSNPKFQNDRKFYLTTEEAVAGGEYCPDPPPEVVARYEYHSPGAGIEGWMTPGELEWLYQTAKGMGSILELGSWKGRSTHALLSGCKGTVTCVDTWRGSENVGDGTNPIYNQGVDVLEEFKRNTAGVGSLEIVQADSREAAARFAAEGRKFDMVFIDAGHEYDEVARDIGLWRPLAAKVFSGHDYLPSEWMGVVRAVDERVGRAYKRETIWYVPAEELPPGYLWTIAKPLKEMGRYPKDLAELQAKVESGEQFSYTKFGDGEQQCMEGVEGSTVDGQPYSFALNSALRSAYSYLLSSPSAYVAFWRDPAAPNDGGLLLHNTGPGKDLAPLHDFYKAIRESSRHKAFVGPGRLSRAASMLGADFVEVPEKDAFAEADSIWDRLKGTVAYGGIVLLSCGPLAKVLAARIMRDNPSVTCIDTGSSFDPLFLGSTRTNQVPQAELQGLYADLLRGDERIPRRIFSIWLNDQDGGKLPPPFDRCIASQRQAAREAGYEHHLIDLENCPRDIPYVNAAIAARKWAKAADYLRVWELRERGGIYLDADMEVLPGRSFNALLGTGCSFLCCREENGFIANSFLASEPGLYICRDHLAEVEDRFRGDDDKVFEAAMEILTPRIGRAAEADRGVRILPPEVCLPYNHQTGTINVTPNTVAFHHFAKSWGGSKDVLPRVCILLPTLGRPEGLRMCLESIEGLYYPKHLLRTVVDDGEGTVPQKVNRMAAANPDADCYVYAANDMTFDPWCVYRAVQMSKAYGLVSFNAGPVYPDEGNICEHFLITRGLCLRLGEIFSEKFHHVGCDNLLWAMAKALGQAARCEEARIGHRHFSRGAPLDDVYHKGWSHVEDDRRVLAEELKRLGLSPPSYQPAPPQPDQPQPAPSGRLLDDAGVEVMDRDSIPRRIFTIWLSDGGPVPGLVSRCIATQRLPGYEHRVITLDDADPRFTSSEYFRQALACKDRTKWTKMSDYLRIRYLLEEGGIYLDADVEVLPGKSFDRFLRYRMFAGRESRGWASTHLIGAEPGYPFLRSWLEKVEKEFRGDDGKVFETSIECLTKGYDKAGWSWDLSAPGSVMVPVPAFGWYNEGFRIFPPEYFCPFRPDHESNPRVGKHYVTPNTVALHRFMNSWQEPTDADPETVANQLRWQQEQPPVIA